MSFAAISNTSACSLNEPAAASLRRAAFLALRAHLEAFSAKSVKTSCRVRWWGAAMIELLLPLGRLRRGGETGLWTPVCIIVCTSLRALSALSLVHLVFFFSSTGARAPRSPPRGL